MPQPRTAIVVPPASNAPRCASASTPRASPLTTTARPRRGRGRAPARSGDRRQSTHGRPRWRRRPTRARTRPGRPAGTSPAADRGSTEAAAGRRGQSARGSGIRVRAGVPAPLDASKRALNAAKRALRGSPTRCTSVAAANEASASSFTPRAPSASDRRAPPRRVREERRPRPPALRPCAPRVPRERGRALTAAAARPPASAAPPTRASAAEGRHEAGLDPRPRARGPAPTALPVPPRAPPPAAAGR